MAKETTIARESRVNPVNAVKRVSNSFSRIGTTRIGDYEVEVRNMVSQDRSRRGLNLNSELYTEIRRGGRVVAWNVTQQGGDKQREQWIREQRRRFNF